MLDFHPITLADKPRADEILLKAANMGCEYCFGTLFIWKNVFAVDLAFKGLFSIRPSHRGGAHP